MPTNYFIFSTGGDWDSTTLYNNGEEYMADRLYIELKSGRDEFGDICRGGLSNGGDMVAYVIPQDSGREVGIFPGRIDLEFPLHKITLINETPNFAIEFTQVILDGQDVTNQIVDFTTNIDPINNDVQAYILLYKPHFLSADEVATINLL